MVVHDSCTGGVSHRTQRAQRLLFAASQALMPALVAPACRTWSAKTVSGSVCGGEGKRRRPHQGVAGRHTVMSLRTQAHVYFCAWQGRKAFALCPHKPPGQLALAFAAVKYLPPLTFTAQTLSAGSGEQPFCAKSARRPKLHARPHTTYCTLYTASIAPACGLTPSGGWAPSRTHLARVAEVTHGAKPPRSRLRRSQAAVEGRRRHPRHGLQPCPEHRQQQGQQQPQQRPGRPPPT